jgi:hypothetical protein
MKIRIILETFLVPALFGSLIIIKQIYPNFTFNSAIGIGMILGWIFRTLFDSKKYLTNYINKENKVEITYLNFYLREKTYLHDKNNINKIIYENSNWKNLDNADSLKITEVKQNDVIEFRIIEKELKKRIKKELSFSN